jgi:hypothetical protein
MQNPWPIAQNKIANEKAEQQNKVYYLIKAMKLHELIKNKL